MKPHSGPVFIDGMVNSTEIVVHSKANFVKVVQNQLLFRKPLILCANLYCKIVTYREMETTLGISGDQHSFNIAWTFNCKKKFVCVGYHTICQSLKKINKSEWKKCFDNWFKCMQGKYFDILFSGHRGLICRCVGLLDAKACVRIPGQSSKMKYEKNISSATSSHQISGKNSESK